MTKTVLIACAVFVSSGNSWIEATEADWRFVDIEGRMHRPFEDPQTKAVVLVFISADCPVANSYQPLLQRLAAEQKAAGVRFYFVHPRRDLTVEQAREHAHRFGIDVPVVIDHDLAIAGRLSAKVTPEAFVLTKNRAVPAYRGRIDNRYAGYGKKRNAATTSELADALDAVANGRLPEVPSTKAVGCYISYGR